MRFLKGDLKNFVSRQHYDELLESHNGQREFLLGLPNDIRRGRFYARPDGKSDAGLLFMCLNADIERQFEFIQQTWCMAGQFMGLENEVDPILGRGGKMGRITIPTPSGSIFLSGTPDAVTVIGGEYFFLPSRSALTFLGHQAQSSV